MTAKFIGALTRWVFKGCKTNLFKELNDGEKETVDLIIGYIVALFLVGLGLLLLKYNLW